MKIRLNEQTKSFLLNKAKELGVSPEALASSLLEEFCQQGSSHPYSFQEYRSLSYGELSKLTLEGSEEQRQIASLLRTRFIR